MKFRDISEIKLEALMEHLGLAFSTERCDICHGRKTDPRDFTNMTVCPRCYGDGVTVTVFEDKRGG